VNFARDVVGAAPPGKLAIVELARDGARREWSFGEVAGQAARLHARLDALGARRGDVVLTLLGNRPEWVLTMVACFRAGYAVLPCTEQLRPKDLRLRLDVTGATLVVADERNRDALEAAGWHGPTLWAPWDDLPAGDAPPAELDAREPCLVAFTSGTSGEPKAVLHGQGYLPGQRLQAEHWLAADEGDLVWCTAASGWSKSARNAFIAPWLRGAAALLHDARFDPAERLDIAEREGVNVLCMAPTEYRVIANRVQPRRIASLRGLVAAGEALDPDVLGTWHEVTGLWIRDGYGQTETGQLTGHPPGATPRPGSMGRPLPGVTLTVEDGELTLDPATDPTFFLHYLGEDPHSGPWRTGDLVRADDEVDAVERLAHRAGARLLAERRAGELARLGLAVAVADPEPERVVPGVQDLRVERLAGRDDALEARQR